MISPRITWAALAAGLGALAAPAATDHFTSLFGPHLGSEISTAVWIVSTFVTAVSLVITARGRSIDPKTDAGPVIPPAPLPAPSTAPESSITTMASLLQTILQKFVAPEEHELGKALAAAYAANKPAVVAALSAAGIKYEAVIDADVDALLVKAFGAVEYGSILEPVLEPPAQAAINSYIAGLIAQVGGEAPVVEAMTDKIVSDLVAYLEAA